jgi:hypothetical protein
MTKKYTEQGIIPEYPMLRVWTKCCECCAYRKDRGYTGCPGESRMDTKVAEEDPEAIASINEPFFCVHRIAPAGDRQYVCAGWWAVHRGSGKTGVRLKLLQAI